MSVSNFPVYDKLMIFNNSVRTVSPNLQTYNNVRGIESLLCSGMFICRTS